VGLDSSDFCQTLLEGFSIIVKKMTCFPLLFPNPATTPLALCASLAGFYIN